MTRERGVALLKMLPGLLISAFFLWFTYIRKNAAGVRGFNPDDFRGLRLVAPAWILGVVGAGCAGYWVRSYRWWRMMRSTGSRLRTCFRVLMTSLAANNILPLRIGDVMRVFTYSDDLHAIPSFTMSTLLLEKLLDVFTLVLMLVITIHTGKGVSAHTRVLAKVLLVVSTTGLVLMVAGARVLVRPVQWLFAKLPAKLAKIEHWILMALEAVRNIGILGMVWLFVLSLVAWGLEGVMYLSAMRLIGLDTDWGGPWQTVAVANLSFLIPSSPGGIGPFEWACKSTLVNHGASASAAGLFGLLIHLWLLVAITGVGGGMFFAHRIHRARRKPLLEEVDALPAELPG